MPRWLWVGLIGILLFAPGAWYWLWVWISDPVRTADTSVAFERLAEVPLNRADGGAVVEFTTTTPSGRIWNRITRDWGAPEFIIAAVSAGPKGDMHCLSELGVQVEATVGGQPIRLAAAERAPYGYSLRCHPAGLRFQTPPGTALRIRFQVSGKPRGMIDLIVEPYWGWNMKDRLVGLAIEEELHNVREITTAVGLAGLGLVTWASFLFSRRKTP